MSLQTIADKYTVEIDAQIRTLLETRAPFAADMSGYFFGWTDEQFEPVADVQKGKRLRPIMCLLACEAIAGSHTRALPLAVAIELIHNYSLIHDDIADRDDERRGRPTVWKIWGDGLAINTGSALYTLAFQALEALDVPPAKALHIYKIVFATSMRLSEGQHWDINYERSVNVTQEMYLNMIEGKTAALLEMALRTGAMVATDDERVIEGYRNFGRHLGLAFQIQDDYLNIWVATERSGKTQFSDLRNKKKSLPVTYALGTLHGDERERFAAIYADVDHDMTDDEIREVLAVLDRIGAKEYTAQLADYHTTEALRCLDSTGLDNPAHAQLKALAQALLGRTQ
jgi:geranylgeranyl diphosphate synthase type I